jgi:TonB family protein
MRVLLVDHDSEALEAIARAIRGVLELDAVTSKGDALLLLRQNTYDVLIACERCVDGSGLDLLGRTTRTSVPLKRIFAAAPERLQLLGPRLAPFKVQRTINYPIDLEELWLAIAQVTGGPNDETDGTIERVVLDERGIPSNGTTPRSPIPPRPPAPLAGVRSPAAPPPQVAPLPSTGTSGRYATARLAQPAPEPPLRAPPPPRQPPPRPQAAPPVRAPVPPATPSDTGRMRAPLPPATTSDTGRMRAAAGTAPATTSDTGRMRAPAPPVRAIPPMPVPPAKSPGPRGFADWQPDSPVDEDLASIAEQAKLGVQQQVVDEHSRLVKKRLLTAGGIAVAVAVVIGLLLQFYDPEARAREEAIAAEVQRMSEQTKTTDNLAMIEIDIENAIMNNELDVARRELARLVELSPNHARKDFLGKSIDRAAELAKLAGREAPTPAAAPTPAPAKLEPSRVAERSRPEVRTAERSRTAQNAPARADRGSSGGNASRPRDVASAPSTGPQRTFGAPIGEQPRQVSIPLDAPINATPTTSSTMARNGGSAFGGRTVESSDRATMGSAPVTPVASAAPAYSPPAPVSNAGSATVTTAGVSPVVSAPSVNVVPAKLVKRVTPVAPSGVPRKTAGFVTVKFNIGANGRVGEVEVVESQPQGVFDDSAQTAVKKWLYEPRKENGVPVESSARAKLVFEAAD